MIKIRLVQDRTKPMETAYLYLEGDAYLGCIYPVPVNGRSLWMVERDAPLPELYSTRDRAQKALLGTSEERLFESGRR